jgi:FkbM family methyltransferase
MKNDLSINNVFENYVDFKNSSIIDGIKLLWLSANWNELSKLKYEDLDSQDNDGWIALFIAMSLHQLGAVNDCYKFLKIAKHKKITDVVIKRTLFSNLLNSLARAKILNGEEEQSFGYFKNAISCVMGSQSAELYANIRISAELSNLGFMPYAASNVNKQIDNLDLTDRPLLIDSKLDIIRIELELINHNIMLLHKKNQLYQSADDLSEGESFEDRITRLSPSQLGQDLWVLDKFAYKRGGFFIEFGATDGIMLSNTYLLEKEFGWHGLLAEPNPVFYEKLKINRTSLCSDACISKNTGEKVEFVLADEFGGIGEFALAGKHKDKVNSYKEYDNVIEVMTISLEDFLIQNDAPSYIEYLSVDTEGSEYSILKDFPFDKWNIQLITVEHNFEPQRELIFQLLSAYGYKRIESKWDDWYYKEQEYRDI